MYLICGREGQTGPDPSLTHVQAKCGGDGGNGEQHPDFNRKSLSNGVKLPVEEEAYEEKCDYLLSLEREGQMFRNASSDAAKLWGNALMQLI